jgi:hypothetical protein
MIASVFVVVIQIGDAFPYLLYPSLMTCCSSSSPAHVRSRQRLVHSRTMLNCVCDTRPLCYEGKCMHVVAVSISPQKSHE